MTRDVRILIGWEAIAEAIGYSASRARTLPGLRREHGGPVYQLVPRGQVRADVVALDSWRKGRYSTR